MNPFRLVVAASVAIGCPALSVGKTRVLILSGANNHDWRHTTPAIKSALEETGRFEVDVEERVMEMKPAALAPYAAIVSNFNTFGKDAPDRKEWPEQTRRAFLDHIAKGHGLVIVHAGSSMFYDWPEFQKLACGTWKDGTSHGAIHVNRVTFTGVESPITKGLAPFWIRDEFWQNTHTAPGAWPLASVTPDPAFRGSGKPEPVVFSTETGGGRGFALFLGHDATAMRNPAWKTLLQRGTEWAATGRVTIPPAKDWPSTREAAENAEFSWLRTDTSLALRHRGKIVWRLVFDPACPKSYFHPLATVDGEVLTAFEPNDHPWHRGLWWSWKYINGINYWEEDPKTHASKGMTELTHAAVTPVDDFSARAELHFSYHPPGKPAVMNEIRRLAITAPDDAGTYAIDWTSEFTAGDAPVRLDRTPPPSRGGPAYGGYAGLSLRFPPGLTGWTFHTSEGDESAATGNGKPARWADLSGPVSGIAILDHPGNLRHPQPWYLSDKPSLVYFSPALLFNEPLELGAGKTLSLRYRVVVHSKPITPVQIEQAWRAFSAPHDP